MGWILGAPAKAQLCSSTENFVVGLTISWISLLCHTCMFLVQSFLSVRPAEWRGKKARGLSHGTLGMVRMLWRGVSRAITQNPLSFEKVQTIPSQINGGKQYFIIRLKNQANLKDIQLKYWYLGEVVSAQVFGFECSYKYWLVKAVTKQKMQSFNSKWDLSTLLQDIHWQVWVILTENDPTLFPEVLVVHSIWMPIKITPGKKFWWKHF